MVIIRKLIKLKQVLHTLSIFQRRSTGCLVFLEIWTDIEVEFLAHLQHIDLGRAVEDLGKADVVGLVVGIWNGNHIKYGLNDGVLTKSKTITKTKIDSADPQQIQILLRFLIFVSIRKFVSK